MKGHNPNYYIIPQSTIDGDTKTVWYDLKQDTKNKGHITLHDDDIDYINFWLCRFVTDVSAKQFLDPDLYKGMALQDKKTATSGYKNKESNSILSEASGLVSNRLRNPSQDYTKKQLPFIVQTFIMIFNIYNDRFSAKDLGYDYHSKQPNKKPLMIKFKEVK
jgi:hypothetical protein|tara:strand:+ start:42 stop:527 length:486 start_codon:yes stop_codon:yes gene_type:complete